MALLVFKTSRPGGRAVGGWVRFPHASANLTVAGASLTIQILFVIGSRSYPPHLPTAPRGRISQCVYVGILLLAIATSGLLRSFHAETPRLLPGPLGSALALAFIALLGMHLVQRRDRRDLFPPLERRGGLRPGLALPLIVVLLGEKWLSVELLAEALDGLVATLRDPQLADAAYRLVTGLALLGCSLAFVWILRQSRHRIARLVRRERAGRSLLYFLLAFLATGAFLVLISAAAGGGSWSFPDSTRDVLVLAALGQVVRAAAEEVFYRGLLQTALVRLLTEAGLGEGRLPRLLAIAAVSLGFALEHVDPGADPGTVIRELAFVFAMSGAFGALLEASRNLYLVVACHAVLNLCLIGVLPLPVSAGGELLIPPALVGALFMIAVFVAVVIEHRKHGAVRGRTPEDGATNPD